MRVPARRSPPGSVDQLILLASLSCPLNPPELGQIQRTQSEGSDAVHWEPLSVRPVDQLSDPL